MRQCKNWIGSYLEYTEHQESPDLFHFWTGVSCVAVALGRKVWLDQGAYKIFPNHYIVLVAKTAQCRKSTAARIGRDLIRKSEVSKISAERLTDAYLWQQLGELSLTTGSATLYTFVDELKNYLRPDDARSGVITTLTTLYGCPDFIDSGTKTAGVDCLKNACMNILAATTPRDFSEIIPAGSTESGFVPRVHIVHQEVPRPRISRPRLVEELEPGLIEDLKRIAALKGEVRLSKRADEWWTNWYENEFGQSVDERLDGWYGKKHDYVLKLGLVLSVAKGDELVVEEKHLIESLNQLDELEVFMLSMYDGVEAVPSLKYAESVLGHIREAGEISHSQLLRMQGRRMDARGLQEVCQFLLVSGRIDMERTEGGRGFIYKMRRKGKNG